METLVEEALRSIGRADGVLEIAILPRVNHSEISRVTYADGSQLITKMVSDGPSDLLQVEAEGLEALKATHCVRTPEVFAVVGNLIVLESLRPVSDVSLYWESLATDLDEPHFWESLAADIAALHAATEHNRFGWYRYGYLGRLPQHNDWNTDGHQFFAEHRLLRYLEEPLVQETLTLKDRRSLERLCEELPSVIPLMPPVLTHGDLWTGNLLATSDGHPVLIDPAVSYGWAEVDLAMMWGSPRPPGSSLFFDRYQELHPSEPGWEERMPILYLRESLSEIAHVGNMWRAADKVKQVLEPFCPGS
jgi:fructosamine-3-kinase